MSTLDSLKGFEMLKPSRSVLTPTPPKVLIEAKKKKELQSHVPLKEGHDADQV